MKNSIFSSEMCVCVCGGGGGGGCIVFSFPDWIASRRSSSTNVGPSKFYEQGSKLVVFTRYIPVSSCNVRENSRI